MPTPPYIMHSNGAVREGRTVFPANAEAVDVIENELTFIRIDHQVRLQFGQTEVVIESPFRLLSNGGDLLLDPERREDLGPLLSLYPGILRELCVLSDGALRLEFVAGGQVTVPPDPHYEAWEINGPGTRVVVCGPGCAALSVWD